MGRNHPSSYVIVIVRVQRLQLNQQLLEQTLSGLGQHQGDHDLQHLRFQVHRRGIREGLQNMFVNASCPQEILHGSVQSGLRAAILFRSDLGVQSAHVEQNAGFFEGNGALARWNSCVGI